MGFATGPGSRLVRRGRSRAQQTEPQMISRRSRIGRIYRHLTHRTPNRRAQWKQIVHMRPQGPPGNPSATRRQVSVPSHECNWVPAKTQETEVPQWLPAEPAATEGKIPEQGHGSGALVAVLSTSLFLMGCGYAAFAGYLLSFKPTAAYCAVAASIVSLLAAGIGISLAASERHRRYSGQVLGIAVMAMAAIYGILVVSVI